MDMINFNSKKQRFQFQKLLKELNQHDEFVILSDFQTYIGFNGDSGNMYAVLENLPNMKDEETLCIYADKDGEVYYMLTGEDGEETEYTYGELLNLGEKCEICGKTEKDCINEGILFNTGCLTTDYCSNRVLCPDCMPHDDEEEEEEEEEGEGIYLFEFQGKTYFKSLDYDFIYDREKKEVIGKWSEELQKIILNDEED